MLKASIKWASTRRISVFSSCIVIKHLLKNLRMMIKPSFALNWRASGQSPKIFHSTDKKTYFSTLSHLPIESHFFQLIESQMRKILNIIKTDRILGQSMLECHIQVLSVNCSAREKKNHLHLYVFRSSTRAKSIIQNIICRTLSFRNRLCLDFIIHKWIVNDNVIKTYNSIFMRFKVRRNVCDCRQSVWQLVLTYQLVI